MSILIGICGGSGSGKTTLANALVAELGPDQATALSLDSYYLDLSHLDVAERAKVNFDHPDSIDTQLLLEHLQLLRSGGEIPVPIYDFSTHTRSPEIQTTKPVAYIIIEGILLFSFEEIRRTLDFLIYRRCPTALRATRREERDVIERGRSRESVRKQWEATVVPMHLEHVEPYASHAHLDLNHEIDVAEAVPAIIAELGSIDRT